MTNQATKLMELAKPDWVDGRFETLTGQIEANRVAAEQYRGVGSPSAIAKAETLEREVELWQREVDSIRKTWVLTPRPHPSPDRAAIPVTVRRVTPASDEDAFACLGGDNTHDEMAAALMRLEAYLERGEKLKELLHSRLIAWINAHGRIVVGPIEYYVGQTKPTPKCRNVGRALDAAFSHFGGSVDDVAKELLGSQPFKYGAFKALLGPEAYAEHFFVEPKPKLESTGEPKPKLQRVDTTFVP